MKHNNKQLEIKIKFPSMNTDIRWKN